MRHTTLSPLPRFALPSLLALAALPALCDEPSKDGWSGTAGIGVQSRPEYDGAKDYQTRAIPMLALNYRYGWVQLGTSGLSVWAVDTPEWQAGFRVGYDGGREDKKSNGVFASGSDKLRGMGKLDGTVEGGLFVEWSGLGAPVSLEIKRAPRNKGHGGTHGTLGVSLPLHKQKDLEINAALSASWADQRYTQAYYGITAEQASRTGRPVYTPKAGMTHFDAALTTNWALDQNWFATGSVGYRHLLGDAGRSPLTERKNSPSGMVGVGYKF
ncbi:MipA/OmpV family protein [Chitinimonas naiadis]